MVNWYRVTFVLLVVVTAAVLLFTGDLLRWLIPLGAAWTGWILFAFFGGIEADDDGWFDPVDTEQLPLDYSFDRRRPLYVTTDDDFERCPDGFRCWHDCWTRCWRLGNWVDPSDIPDGVSASRIVVRHDLVDDPEFRAAQERIRLFVDKAVRVQMNVDRDPIRQAALWKDPDDD